MKTSRKSVLMCLVCLAGWFPAFAQGNGPAAEAESSRKREIVFNSYASLEGGAGWTQEGRVYPRLLGVSSGIQPLPWLGIGAFLSFSPLSTLGDARFASGITERDTVYSLATGSELILTPFYAQRFHPFFRLALGGRSVGELLDTDGMEGYDTTHEDRFFLAALSLGAELNLTGHGSLFARGGYEFCGNDDFAGIPQGALRGFEVVVGMRLQWQTILR